MADKTVFFTGLVSHTTLLDLRRRIKTAYSSSGVSTTTPTAGTKITFSDLNSTYQAARQALFALSGSFGSRTLSDFTGTHLRAIHGIGITEKTVGDLENVCVAFFSSNLISEIRNCSSNFSGNKSTFADAINSTNFSVNGTNSSNRSAFADAVNASNFSGNGSNSSNRSSFTAAKNTSNFSGNGTHSSNRSSVNTGNFSGVKSGNRSTGYPFNYMAFHTSQGGKKASVKNSNNKTNFKSFGNNSSKRSSFKGSNFSGVNNAKKSSFTAAKNTSNFSGVNNANKSSFTAASNTANFSGVNNANKSSFTAASNTSNFSGNNGSFFSSFTPAFFSSNAKTCIAVHANFRVEGVDF